MGMFAVEVVLNIMTETTWSFTCPDKDHPGTRKTINSKAFPAQAEDGALVLLTPPFGIDAILKPGKQKVRIIAMEFDKGVTRATFATV